MWCVHESKQTRKPFSSVRQRATRHLELIHTNLSGQLDPPTFDGYNYYMTILHHYTHFTIYLLKYKCEAGRFLRKFIVESGNELNQKVAQDVIEEESM
jgi:hypothetical protein